MATKRSEDRKSFRRSFRFLRYSRIATPVFEAVPFVVATSNSVSPLNQTDGSFLRISLRQNGSGCRPLEILSVDVVQVVLFLSSSRPALRR